MTQKWAKISEEYAKLTKSGKNDKNGQTIETFECQLTAMLMMMIQFSSAEFSCSFLSKSITVP